MITVAAANPFPGLRPFEADQADLFFGRDEQIEELLVRLERTRFLAVLGASGSGKSSLVRAGLVPALQRGYFGGANWRTVIFRPGGYPITEFAAALSDVFLQPQPEILSTLRRSSLGLVDFSRQYLQSAQSLLIVIDQFEELSRYRNDPSGRGTREESAAFVKLLLAATGHSELPTPESDDLPIYVVLTMRSDFLGKCSQFRGLPEAMNDSQYLVPRMSREQRREAIEGPIGMAGARITPQLVQRLLNDVGDSPDQLPVLQHALMRTWEQASEERQQGKPIDLPTYESVGRMESALNLDAERAFAELCADSKLEAIARRIFQSLVEPGADDEETRRPGLLSELVAVTGAENGKVREVIDVFHRAGFLTLSHDVDPVVDISHESLIRLWDRLNGWVKEETESAEIYLRLATSASKTMALYRDPELTQALRWKKREDPNAAWARRYSDRDPAAFSRAMDFLSRSLAARRREQWIRRGAIFGLCLLSVALTLVAFVAWTNAREARKNARTAEQSAKDADNQRAEAQKEQKEAVQGRLQAEDQKRRADEQEKAAQKARLEAERQRSSALSARDRAEVERTRADKEKIEADREHAEAEKQRAIVGSEHLASSAHDLVTKAAQLLKDDPSKIEVSVLLSIESLHRKPLFENDQSTREWLGLLPGAESDFVAGGPVEAVAFSPDGHYLATAGEDGAARLFDIAAGRTAASRLSQEGSVKAIALSPDGRLLGAGNDDNTARIPEILTQKEILGARPAVAFGPDGKHVAISDGDGTARVFDVATRKEVYSVSRPSAVNAMNFSPDGRYVAIAKDDGSVRIIERTTGSEVSRVSSLGHLSGLIFSPDGEYLATTSRDKTAYVFETATGTKKAHKGSFNAAAFSPDGRYLLTGSEDGTSRVFEIETGEEKWQVKHSGPIRAVAFSPDGHFIVTGGEDKTARLFSFPEGQEVSRLVHRGSVTAVAFSPDGRVATGSADGIARVFDSGGENKLGVVAGAGRAVALSPDGRYLATASRERPVIDLNGREKVSVSPTLEWPSVAVAFSPDGGRAVFITSDGVTVHTKVLELATRDVTPEKAVWINADTDKLPFPTAGGQALAVSPDGNLLATGSAAAFTRDGRFVAISPHPISIARPRSTDRTTRVVDVATGTEIPLRARGDRVLALAFSRDGGYVATGSNEGASIYDAKTGEETSHFPHQRSVECVVLSPDGLYIATADIDNNVHTFNVTTGGEASRFSLDEPVRALAFTREGRSLRVVSGSSAISYRDYSLVPEDLIIKACSQVQRNLTHEEWGRYLGNEAYRKTCPNLPEPPPERR
jgi:WD40 repeat protein